MAFYLFSFIFSCFVDTGPPLFYGVVLPIAAILLFNFVMFSLVSYHLCKTNLGGSVQDKSKSQQAIQRLQNAFAMSILMGLTWVFGFFAIEDAKFAFTLIFCLCNSFQGLVLFLLFCARQEDVRKTLRPYMQRLCCKSPSSFNRSQTASTGVLSSKSSSKSPYSDMDFSASAPPSKSPYSDMDFSAAVPMSPLSSADNPTYDTTADAMEQKAVPVAIKEAELQQDTEMTPIVSDSGANFQAATAQGVKHITRTLMKMERVNRVKGTKIYKGMKGTDYLVKRKRYQ